MIDLLVTRNAGDLRGDDVIEPLLGSVATALARGRAEIDAQAERMQLVTVETVYRDGLRRGQLVRFNDSTRGTWSGKVVGITHAFDGPVVKTTLRVLRKVIDA